MKCEHEDALEAALQRERRAGRESLAEGHRPPDASLLTSCVLCKQLHRPEQQFEFHPICPVCTQTSE